MSNWFYNPEVQFQMWSFSHIATLILIVVCLLAIYLFRTSLSAYRHVLRITVGSALILSRISLDVWYMTTGQWAVNSSLPLELCSIASLLSGVMLLTKSRRLFELVYFIAIGGAMQAILTPDLFYGFPQYRYIQFFSDHFMLILAPLIMIWFYQFTITKKSLIKSFLFLNALALLMFIVNHLLSANYMFLRHKPQSASLLDFLGPYPYYLLTLELIALFIFVLLYLPFARRNRKV